MKRIIITVLVCGLLFAVPQDTFAQKKKKKGEETTTPEKPKKKGMWRFQKK